jgi:hypothetical protein
MFNYRFNALLRHPGYHKKDSDPPDYSQVAQASKEAAEIMANLGQDQLAENKRQYENNMRITEPVVAAQLGLMNQQQAQGDDYFNYMKQNARPVEQQLMYESMGFSPEEIQQIEESRARETAAWNAKVGQQQQQSISKVVDVPTYSTKEVYPDGAIKGTGKRVLGASTTSNSPVGGLSGISLPNYITLDPNKYYVKDAQGRYREVQPKTEIVEGTKSVTLDAQRGDDGTYSVMETPETDALVAKLGAQASARLAAMDKSERDAILGKSNDLATRIGETNAQVYDRYKDDIEAEAGLAAADSRAGYTNALNTAIRQGLRYGFSPAKVAASAGTMSVTQGAQQAAAQNATRKAATETMYGRGVGAADQALKGLTVNRSNRQQDEAIRTGKKLDVAGLYRNLPGASQGSYGLAVSAGNSAVNNQNSTSQLFMNGINQGNNTIAQGQQTKVNGLSNVLGAQTSAANAAGDSSGLWSAVGTIGGALIASDEAVKKDVKDVSDDEALESVKGLDVKRWKYDGDKIEGMDDKEHIGPMAQDAKKQLGSRVSDGRVIDVISALGVNLAATKALAKKVDKMGVRHE